MTDRNSTSSITEKVTGCMSCAKPVTYRTNNRVYCAMCRVEAKLKKDRAAAEARRRKAGVEQVKGTTAACAACGSCFERSNIRNIRCKPCQRGQDLARARRTSVLRRACPVAREMTNEWSRENFKVSPRRRVGNHFRVMMHRALGSKKEGRSWREFVDYSLEDLMLHLERQFQKGMTWDNQGEWHIDHIVPQSSFRFSSPDDQEFKACWCLSNLRPLWAKDNIRKNAKREFLI